MPTPLSYAQSVLASRLLVVEARRATFEPGYTEAAEKLKFSLILVVRRGRFPYTVNGRERVLTRGTAILAPAGARRSWTIPDGSGVDASWFRYRCLPDEPVLTDALVGTCATRDLEDASVERMRTLFKDPDPAVILSAEGEAKAMIGRVVPRLRPLGGDVAAASPRRGDAAVNRAVRFLDVHYSRRDALEAMAAKTPMSVTYFRKIFRTQVGLSPQAFLTRRRMQQARYLLRTASMSVQEVADGVGYDDPLYFSRVYAKFWGRPPSADQTRSWIEAE